MKSIKKNYLLMDIIQIPYSKIDVDTIYIIHREYVNTKLLPKLTDIGRKCSVDELEYYVFFLTKDGKMEHEVFVLVSFDKPVNNDHTKLLKFKQLYRPDEKSIYWESLHPEKKFDSTLDINNKGNKKKSQITSKFIGKVKTDSI